MPCKALTTVLHSALSGSPALAGKQYTKPAAKAPPTKAVRIRISFICRSSSWGERAPPEPVRPPSMRPEEARA
ncbi:MAG: hypothetical protein NVSMB26_01130 [Beijerinckiaceae bacterium]